MEDRKLGRAAGVVIAYVFWNHRLTALVDFLVHCAYLTQAVASSLVFCLLQISGLKLFESLFSFQQRHTALS